MTRTAKLLLIPVFCAQLLLFLFIAQHRFVDSDEGFYLLASRLVLMHKRPYLDFFLQQAPLLPYVYSLWLKCFHLSWYSARNFAALLTASLGTFIYLHVSEQTRKWKAGVTAVVLFGSSTLVFAWMPVAKPYSLAGLLLFIAYFVVSRPSTGFSGWLLAVAGVSAALAVDTRSYLVLTVPLFLWWLYRYSPRRLVAVSWFLGGFAAGLVPSLYFFLASPRAFLFDNLGYHAIRTDAGLVGMWGQKLVVLLMLFLGGPEGNGIQNALLFVLSLAFLFSVTRPDSSTRLAFQLAVVLGVISLLPTPVLPQYFAFCIPFLIVSTVCVANELLANLNTTKARSAALAACGLLLVLYIAASVSDFRKYLVTGDGIPTVRWAADRGDWRLQRVTEVSQAIDQIARPSETVASVWPGYLFLTEAVPFPGLETDCGILIAGKLTSEQLAKYHLVSWTQLDDNLAAQVPRVVVMANHYNHESFLVPSALGDTAKASLVKNGYTVARTLGDTAIYVCCSATDRTLR